MIVTSLGVDVGEEPLLVRQEVFGDHIHWNVGGKYRIGK